MSTLHDSERLLPAPEELEIAEHLMGSYLSALDSIAIRVTRESEPVSIEEYLRLRDAGASEILDAPRFDDAELLELVRFTADALRDAESIRQQAMEIQRLALAHLHDQRDRYVDADDPRWLAHQHRIRSYHEAQIASDERGA